MWNLHLALMASKKTRQQWSVEAMSEAMKLVQLCKWEEPPTGN